MNPSRHSDASSALANGFADTVVGWALEQSNGVAKHDTALLDILGRAARQVSHATSNGHACALLVEVFDQPNDPNPAQVREYLLRSGTVGTPQAPEAKPLILDDGGRLYLHRYFDYEQRLAYCLRQPHPAPATVNTEARNLLQQLFAPNQAALNGRPDWQQLAAALALRQPFTIISGGPGTGKTTTVVNLLACLLAQDRGCRIALAAPTGKAAARMLEAIRARATHLPDSIRAQLPQQSYTVHRLLGATHKSGVFRHDATHPLALDALVVDEASMLDLALAVKLFEALPPTARIILLGDKDQLAAVESGAIFAELCADPSLSTACRSELAALTGIAATQIEPAPALKPTGLADSVVWFTENFRFRADSGIGRLALGIGGGDPAPVLDWLRAQDGSEVRWSADAGSVPAPTLIDAMSDGYVDYVTALLAIKHHYPSQNTDLDLNPLFDAFNRFRVLCALRSTARGVEHINALLSARLQPRLGAAANAIWYVGRPIIILRNDYALRLYNGDIGIVLPNIDDGELMVYFPDNEGGMRRIAPGRLPQHETAFALTIHKAQGSEFERVLLLLPEQPNRVITRELLYTGVTRARTQVHLAGPAAVIEYAIRTPTQRHSGLRERMRDE